MTIDQILCSCRGGKQVSCEQKVKCSHWLGRSAELRSHAEVGLFFFFRDRVAGDQFRKLCSKKFGVQARVQQLCCCCCSTQPPMFIFVFWFFFFRGEKHGGTVTF